MAIISISYEEFQRFQDIEEKYNLMLKTWKPISEKSLQKAAEKELKALELVELKQAQKEQKAVEKEQKAAEKKALKSYISYETLVLKEMELKKQKLAISRQANGVRLAAYNAKLREEFERFEEIYTQTELPNLIDI